MLPVNDAWRAWRAWRGRGARAGPNQCPCHHFLDHIFATALIISTKLRDDAVPLARCRPGSPFCPLFCQKHVATGLQRLGRASCSSTCLFQPRQIACSKALACCRANASTLTTPGMLVRHTTHAPTASADAAFAPVLGSASAALTCLAAFTNNSRRSVNRTPQDNPPP